MNTSDTALEQNDQAPLGPEPSYDELLDTAVEYTFPCSDPIAVETCCAKRAKADPKQTTPPRADR
jgi:hypothetical protein